MQREQIISALEKEYNPSNAWNEDSIGLQVEGTKEISKILITLDVTLEVISQAISGNVNMIISHHPLIFGDKEIALKKNMTLKSKLTLLEKQNINVYIIHTNIDFGINSIPFLQAKKMELKNVKNTVNNDAIIGKWEKEFTSSVELVKFIKETFAIDYQIRTNIINTKKFTNITIASGASGDILYDNSLTDNLFIIGELKWNHWIYANEMNLNVIEIGHFSETIFKEIIIDFIGDNFSEIKILEGIEENGYSNI